MRCEMVKVTTATPATTKTSRTRRRRIVEMSDIPSAPVSIRTSTYRDVVDLDQHRIVDVSLHRGAHGEDVVLLEQEDVGSIFIGDLLGIDIELLALLLVDGPSAWVIRSEPSDSRRRHGCRRAHSWSGSNQMFMNMNGSAKSGSRRRSRCRNRPWPPARAWSFGDVLHVEGDADLGKRSLQSEAHRLPVGVSLRIGVTDVQVGNAGLGKQLLGLSRSYCIACPGDHAPHAVRDRPRASVRPGPA